jgi:hypothetical protein
MALVVLVVVVVVVLEVLVAGGWWLVAAGHFCQSSFRNPGGNVNVRNDGSVDYASLNEDWASRSEEDPHWWTQGGGGADPV